METAALLALVDERLARDDQALGEWADPHPGSTRPRDEEYSRLLDPGKYRILGSRMDAWTGVLTTLGAATAEEVDVSGDLWRHPPSPVLTRATRVVPMSPGAQPLLVGRTRLGDVDGCGLYLGVGDPAVVGALVPVCGCDACDDGSEALLRELDEAILDIISGSFVHVEHADWSVTAGRSGWEASNFHLGGSAETWLAAARAGRSPYDMVTGAAWLDGLI